MTRPLLIFLIILLLTACLTKKGTKQLNLNQTIGWKSDNPNDYTVLFIKTNQLAANADHIPDKRKFDEAVLKELKANRIGDQAENDEQSEKDFHFIVSKDYQKAVATILSVAETYNMKQQITVYQRVYQSFDKWTDKVVYPD